MSTSPTAGGRTGTHNPPVLEIAVALGTLLVCLTIGWWLYSGDRVARSWAFPPTQGTSYGALVRSDGVGYLAWTYALTERDLCFAPFIAETLPIQSQEASGFRLATSPGCFLPQYTMGQGLLWAPWVIAARAIPQSANGAPQGSWVSRSSGFGMLLGSGLVAAIGVAATIWALRRRFDALDAVVATTAVFIGTYGLHYATFDAQFSHATSFGLFGVLLALTTVLRRRIQAGRGTLAVAVALGATAGMIGLVRLPNIAIALAFTVIALAIPFRTRWRQRAANGPAFRRSLSSLLAAAAVVAVVLSAQTVIWRAASGQWLPKTYVGQGFSVSEETPVILARILIDPEWHGFLVWSPIALVAAAGFVAHRARLGWLGWGSIAAIAAMLATSAAWTFPTGAGGLGLRFMIDVGPFLAVGVALALRWSRDRSASWARPVLVGLIVVVALWSISAMIAYWSLRFAITGAPLSQMLETITTPRLP